MKKALKWGGLALLCVVVVALVALYVAVTYRWEGDYFDSNGVSLHYVDEGNPQGEPVILVHGFAANADINWRYSGVIRTLTDQGYRVIAVDNRGHGLSGKPHDETKYGIEMVNDVARLMDHLEIPRAHLVGYSMGGLITLKAVDAFPERLISATVGGAGWLSLDSPKVQILQRLAQSLDEGKGFGPLVNELHPDSLWPGMQARVATFGIDFINDVDALRAALPGMREWVVDEASILANEVPLLVICGTEDPMNEGAHNIEGVGKNTTVVYVDGGDHASTVLKRIFRESISQHITASTADADEPTDAVDLALTLP